MIEWLIAVIPTIISLGALWTAIFANTRSKSVAQSQVFLDLRKQYYELHDKLPEGYEDPSWRPRTKKEQDIVISLVHQLFNEWYITTRLNYRDMHPLWDKYFSDAIQYSLRHRAIRQAFWKVTNHPPDSKNLYRDWRNDIDKVMIPKSTEYEIEARERDEAFLTEDRIQTPKYLPWTILTQLWNSVWRKKK